MIKLPVKTLGLSQPYQQYLVWVGSSVILSGAIGVVLALSSESSISILILLSAIGVLTFLSPQLAFFVTFLFLPFSFRFIIPGRSLEVQTPTEPLLGMLIFVNFVQLVFDGSTHSYRRIRKDKENLHKRIFPLKWPVILFILMHFVSTINSPDTISSIKGSIRASVYILTSFLTFRLIEDRVDLRRLGLVVLPPAVIAVVWTIIVLIYNLDNWQWTSAYNGAPFTNYTAYGQFTVTFLLIVLSKLLIDRSDYDRIIWLALLIVFACGVLMCFSRGVWLALLLSIGFLILNLRQDNLGPKLAFAVVVSVILLVLLILPGTSSLIQERVFTMFDLKFASNQSRILRWGQAFLMFLENPILGNGYGAFAMIYEENPSLSGLYKAQFQLGVHSEHLRILAEMGVLGILTWLGVLFSFFRLGILAINRTSDGFFRSLIVAFLTIKVSMVLLFFFNDLPEGDILAIPFWVVYGLLPAVVQISDQEKNKK